MMKSNLTTYPTAYASPFSGSCFLQQVATPPLTHAFLGKIGLKQKYDLKLNIMKTILLCTLLALGVMQARGQKTESDGKNRLEDFKAFVANRTLGNDLPLLQGRPFQVVDSMREVIVYTDTLKQVLPCVLDLTLNGKGRIMGCNVSGVENELMVKRIKRNVLAYPLRLPMDKGMKKEEPQSRQVELPLPVEGNFVVLDHNLVRPIKQHEQRQEFYPYKETTLPVYMFLFAHILVAQHPGWEQTANLSDRFFQDIEGDKIRPKFWLAGDLKFSFIIMPGGSLEQFEKLEDNLFPEKLFDSYVDKMFRGFGYYKYSFRRDWIPAEINGKAVPVKVVADYDYDAGTYAFRCYLLKEKGHELMSGKM